MKKERLIAMAPVALLVLFWCAKTASIWRDLGSRHYGMRAPLLDVLGMQWMSWWTHLASTSAEHSLFFSDMINHPVGGPSILDDSLAFLHIGAAGLLRGLLGGVAAINLVAVTGFTFSLVAVFLFLREVSGERLRAAVMTCLVVAAALCTANQLPELEFVFFGYLPLALLCWMRYVTDGRRRWLVASASLIGLSSYAQMYYGLSLFIVLGLALPLSFVRALWPEGESRTVLLRTAQVLGGGIGFGALLHARNIYNLVSAAAVVRTDLAHPLPWPYGLFDLFWVLLLVAVPLAFAWRLGARRGVLWALLALPLLLLSAGNRLQAPWGGDVSMPLLWLRRTFPFMWRITYAERFVAPMLLLVGASVLAILRGDAARARRPRFLPASAVAGVALFLFWWGATATPLVILAPAQVPSRPGAPSMLAASPYPPPATPVGLLADRDDNRPGPFPDRRLPWAAASWLLSPLKTFELPPLPRCLLAVADEPGDFAILELSHSMMTGYRAYFQTIHQKRIAGFPFRPLWMGTLRVPAAPLTQYQQDFLVRSAPALPGVDDLRGQDVRYVIRYALPFAVHGPTGPHDQGEPGVGRRLGPADFDAAYGPPICVDDIATVHVVGTTP